MQSNNSDTGSPAARSGVRPPQQQARKSLPQLLLEEGKVPRDQLVRLMEKQKATGAFIGELLVEEGLIEEQSLISFLAKYCKIPHLSLLDYLIDPEILQLVPKEICLEYRLLPIDKLGSNLTVAMVNPLDARALEKVRSVCPSLRIKPILCAYKHFETVTTKAFGVTGTKKNAVDLSASSFGLHIPKAPAAVKEEQNTVSNNTEVVDTPQEPPIPVPAAETVANFEATPPSDTTPEPPYEATPADGISEEKKIDSDALVDDVFQAVSEERSTETLASSDDALGGMMEEMASVMMDSMRDTYDMLSRRMELFHGLKADDVAKIFARGDTIEVEEGKVIFEKGQPGDNMYIILGGSVRIYDSGREIAVLGRGDMFGEMALVSSEPRSASACAAESSSLLALSIDVIRDVMPRDVSVQLLINIVVTLSARLRQANEN